MNTHKRITQMTGAAAACLMLAAACSVTESSAGTTELSMTYSSAFAPGGLNAGMEQWAPALEDQTDGRITVDFHYSESLVSGFETLAAIGAGTVDIGTIPPAYNPSELPLANVLSIPFQTSDPIAQMWAYYEMTRENDALRQEYENANVHVLMLQPAADGAIGLKEPMSDVDDLNGQRLRAIGFVVPGLEALGVESVAINPGEIYESIQRGVVAGYAGYVFDNLHTIGLHEVAPHVYDIGIGQYSVQVIGVNLDVWNSLDEETQRIMTEEAEKFMAEDAAELLMQFESEACDAILEVGGSVTVLPDDRVAQIKDTVGDGPAQAWVESVVDVGVDEDEARGFRDEFLTKLEEHTGEYDYVSGMHACAER